MDIFTIIGVAGGVIVAVIAILLTKYNKKKDKPSEEKKEPKEEKKEDATKDSASSTVAQNPSPAPNAAPQRQMKQVIPTSVPVTTAQRADNVSNQTPAAKTKKEVAAEEKQEERDFSIELEDYKHIFTLFPTINAAFSDLDKLVKEEHFYELLKNKELSKPVVDHVDEIKKIYSEINKEAKELKKKTTDLIKNNKQLLLDAKKLVEIDDKKFEKYEKELLEDAIKLVNEFETTLNSSKRMDDGSANCINFCNNIIQLCKQILDDETDSAFNLAFGKKGAYEQLKKEHESLLSLHFSSILNLKRIEQLLSKIKKAMDNSIVA